MRTHTPIPFWYRASDEEIATALDLIEEMNPDSEE